MLTISEPRSCQEKCINRCRGLPDGLTTGPRKAGRLLAGGQWHGEVAARRVGLEQPLAQRVLDQLGAVVEVQLLHYPLPISVDGLGAEHEPLADLLAGVAFGGKPQDLALAWGKPIRSRVSRLGPLEVLAQQEFCRRGVEEDLVAVDHA